MKLYKYYGGISVMESRGQTATSILLSELCNDGKAPTRLDVYGELAKYIFAIEMTDAEERYLNANWYYDRNLCLSYIEIPSTDPAIPAKVIAQDDIPGGKLTIFGPEEYIETDKPEPMNMETYYAWLDWKFKNLR